MGALAMCQLCGEWVNIEACNLVTSMCNKCDSTRQAPLEEYETALFKMLGPHNVKTHDEFGREVYFFNLKREHVNAVSIMYNLNKPHMRIKTAIEKVKSLPTIGGMSMYRKEVINYNVR